MSMAKDGIRDKEVRCVYTKITATRGRKAWKRLRETEYWHLNIKKPCYDQIICGLDTQQMMKQNAHTE